MVDKQETKITLEEELEILKAKYRYGYEFKLIFLPDERRINKNGSQLKGEVQGNNILIYTSDPKECLEIVTHEFIEHMIDHYNRPLLDIVNSQKELLERLLYLYREELINKLSQNKE